MATMVVVVERRWSVLYTLHARFRANRRMNLRTKARLESAGHKHLVQFTRPFEHGSTMGYVVDIGPRFFLLSLVDELIRFNGFQCLRLQDVRNLQAPARYSKFVAAALKTRGTNSEKASCKSRQSSGTLADGRQGISAYNDSSRKGSSRGLPHRSCRGSERRLSLSIEIGPDARWDNEPLRYRNREITRIDFAVATKRR